MLVGKLSPLGKVKFPGFQEILDFTAAGGEATSSVTVDGDTDKEYKLVIYGNEAQNIYLRLNNDATAGIYGRQYLQNFGGAITATRLTATAMVVGYEKSITTLTLLTPTGFIKTLFNQHGRHTTGTTMDLCSFNGYSYNSTSNITSLVFLPSTGNFTAGTHISVYARRSN